MGANRNVTIHDAVAGAIAGDSSGYQIDPDERDPVSGETADEAEETLRTRGLVNPFHAHELQRRRSARKTREKEAAPTLCESLLAADGDEEAVDGDEDEGIDNGYCSAGVHYLGDTDRSGCRSCALDEYRQEIQRRAERRGAWDEEAGEWNEVDTSYDPEVDA